MIFQLYNVAIFTKVIQLLECIVWGLVFGFFFFQQFKLPCVGNGITFTISSLVWNLKNQTKQDFYVTMVRCGKETNVKSRMTSATAAAKSLQSCPTLFDPMDCSPPGSSAHGIVQTRVLEWVAIAFSRMSSNKCQNLILFEPMQLKQTIITCSG